MMWVPSSRLPKSEKRPSASRVVFSSSMPWMSLSMVTVRTSKVSSSSVTRPLNSMASSAK